MNLSRQEKLALISNNYFRKLNELEEIVKYLYAHTELFEQKYMDDFPEELFRFFSGKIGRYARERNKFLEVSPKNLLNKLKEIEIMTL